MTESELYQYLKRFFIYEDGILKRTDRRNSNGSFDKDGYLIIKIKGKQYKAHRLVYLMFNGKMPENEIDHKNRNRIDNRIENLKDSTRIENIENSIGNGFGVYIDNTNGLKKKFAFKYKKKTYRNYTLEEAIKQKTELGGKINNEYTL